MDKTFWRATIYNCIVLICFTALSIFFYKWWIILFALLFLAYTSHPNRKRTRICDVCGRSSESAMTKEEAIERAKKCGWLHIKDGDLDYCPDCLSKIKTQTKEN